MPFVYVQQKARTIDSSLFFRFFGIYGAFEVLIAFEPEVQTR